MGAFHFIDRTDLSIESTHTEEVDVLETDLSKVRMAWMDAGPVAAAALKSLGHDAAVIPGRLNRLMSFVMTMMPRQIALSLLGSMLSKTMDPAIL